MTLRDLRQQLAAAVAEMRTMIDAAEGAARDLTPDERARFGALRGDIETFERRIADRQAVDDAERAMRGQPLTGGSDRQFDAECRAYSLTRAMAAQAGLDVDVGREREVSRELARRSGRQPEGILAPMSVFIERVEQRVMTGSAGGVGLIASDQRPDLYVDILRAALRVRQLGATVLTGLTGTVDIPRLTTSATAGWVAENAGLTASDLAHDKVSLTPKHVGALTEFSRNLLLQSSPDVEMLIRRDFAAVLAQAVDLAAVKGGGANEPTGILATAGIGSVALGTNGGAPTWDAVLALIGALSDANALGAQLAFLTNGKAVKKMRSTLKTSADTSSNFIMADPAALAGYPLAQTNLVPSNLVKGTSGAVCSALIFGDWSQLLLGYWSEFDVLVNPYDSTAYPKGNVMVRGMVTMDVEVRHAASFAAIQDMLTT
jgi:HK97 family phage major capsid protein